MATDAEKAKAATSLQKMLRGNSVRSKVNAHEDGRAKESSGDGFIRVFVRLRPLGEGRGERGERVAADHQAGKITIKAGDTRAADGRSNHATEAHSFDFERVCTEEEDNEALLQSIGKPLVESVCTGYNGTLFAYGQTGSGKTYTIGEIAKVGTPHEGVAHRMVRALYEEAMAMQVKSFKVEVQFVQIYVEHVHDLLIEQTELVELRKMLTERKFAWVEGGGSACCGFTKSKPKEGSAREHGESEKYNPECGPGEARQGIWRHKDGEVVELHPTPTDVTSKGFASKPSDKTTWRMFRLCVRPTDSMRYPGAFWISGPFWIIPDATLAKMDDAPPTPTSPQLAPGPWRPGQEASAGIIGCGVALSAVGEAEAHVRGTRGRGLELLIGAAAVQTDDDNGSIIII